MVLKTRARFYNAFVGLFFLRGLSNHKDLLCFRNKRDFLRRADHNGVSVAVTFQADHFRMVRFSHDNGQIPFVGVVPDKSLNPRHPGAGGVDDFQTRGFELFAFLRGDSVSADDDGPVLER